jgi:thiol-disulfide isomerase/thioredoxin
MTSPPSPACLVLLAACLASCGAEDTPSKTSGLSKEPSARSISFATLPEIKSRIESSKGSALVVNYWATWCVPCLAEIPDLLRGTREFRTAGGLLLGIALERSSEGQTQESIMDKVVNVADKLKMDFPILICTEDDLIAVREALGFDMGGLPQTVAFDAAGTLVDHHEGLATEAEFREIARKARQ